MKFGIHILPTYMPDVEGALPNFYQQMYDQIIEVEKLGFDLKRFEANEIAE